MIDAFGEELEVGDLIVVARQRKGYSTKGVELVKAQVLKVNPTTVRAKITEPALEADNSEVGQVFTAGQSKRTIKYKQSGIV